MKNSNGNAAKDLVSCLLHSQIKTLFPGCLKKWHVGYLLKGHSQQLSWAIISCPIINQLDWCFGWVGTTTKRKNYKIEPSQVGVSIKSPFKRFWQRRLTYSDWSVPSHLTLFKCSFLSLVCRHVEIKHPSLKTTASSEGSRECHNEVHPLRHWKLEPSIDGRLLSKTDRQTPHQTCKLTQHWVMHFKRRWNRVVVLLLLVVFQRKIAVLCRSRTFVVWMKSVGSVDLTRNVNSRRGNRTGKY